MKMGEHTTMNWQSDSSLILQPSSFVPLPAPRCGAISVRLATPADIGFMDELQKKHQKMLGFMPRKTFEGKIAAGHVLIADCQLPIADLNSSQSEIGNRKSAIPLGYCISQDKYMGHEDVGVFYQVNVAPVQHRKLIGATLVKAVFERAAYGCKLFCCWCAQDIDANYFWESLGFVPLAFRAGNRIKARVHIFWQRRIREGDTTTPYWFPSETRGGMMNEARLVLPIPPGTHWKDAKPVILPIADCQLPIEKPKQLPAGARARSSNRKSAIGNRQSAAPLCGVSFAAPAPAPEPTKQTPKPKREPRPKAKNDPKLVAAARELRDRWMEEINAGRYLPAGNGKYEVSRGELPIADCQLPIEHHSNRQSEIGNRKSSAALPAPRLLVA